MLLRQGGLPKSEEDFDEMDRSELRVVNSFNAFIDKLMFKQQRVLWFFADPRDAPVDAVALTEFFKIKIEDEQMPALLLIKTKEQKVVRFEEVESITQNKIAKWVFANAFTDLARKVDKSDLEKFKEQRKEVVEDL